MARRPKKEKVEAKKPRWLVNVEWIEKHCRLPEGKFVGQSMKDRFAPYMIEDFKAIYREHDDPRGQVRHAIISRGRKNAKTCESAFILLLHLCGPESVISGQLFSAAQSREQAALVFSLAAKMVRMSPELDREVVIRDTAKEILCPARGTKYKALSSETTTAFGLSPVLCIHDELGQVLGPRSILYDAMETAVAAQANPLTVIISTQAPTDADLLSILIDDAKSDADPRTVLRMHTADKDLEPFAIETIRAANPALDIFMNKQEVLAMAEDARRMPARENQYRNLVLNQRVEASNPFVSQILWKACGDEPSDLRGVPVYGGLDLSEVRDLTALVLIGKKDGIWQVRPTFWLPSQGLEDKSRLDHVPYDLWHNDGYLMTTPGASVSYEYVAKYLRDVFDKYNIRKIGFDRWNMKHLAPWLEKAGFSEQLIKEKFVEFGQGTQSMSPALRDLEALIAERELAHGNHPVLSMCAAHAAAILC
jgi:phage terminase large subunit-like protein